MQIYKESDINKHWLTSHKLLRKENVQGFLK